MGLGDSGRILGKLGNWVCAFLGTRWPGPMTASGPSSPCALGLIAGILTCSTVHDILARSICVTSPLHSLTQPPGSEVIEDKIRALSHSYTGEIDQGITEPLVNSSKVVAKLARQRERQGALVIRAIYLLPGRGKEYPRIVAIEMRSILSLRKVKAEECCVAKKVR